MKTIGIIGGMSWQSTEVYYRLMNEYISLKLGKHHSVKAVIYSLDFEEILDLVRKDRWDLVSALVVTAGKGLEAIGVDFIMMTSNAIHKVYPEVEGGMKVPVLHIADPTLDAIREQGLRKVGLLGTRVTMEESFYKSRLSVGGVDVLIPNSEEMEEVHRIIFEELNLGRIEDSSRGILVGVIQGLVSRGAQGIILGCTELSLILFQGDVSFPLFDTAALHARAAVDIALL
jgi:aspartate racemase